MFDMEISIVSLALYICILLVEMCTGRVCLGNHSNRWKTFSLFCKCIKQNLKHNPTANTLSLHTTECDTLSSRQSGEI